MNMAAENHYDVLGIGPDADDDAVKQAFRELAKTLHPDYNPGDEEAERRFKQVNVAYEGLKDEARRQAYNEFLAFAERRKNFKRVQWGRLAALLIVLLLGPSAVMFWLAIPRDISVVQSSVEPQAQPPKVEQAAKPQAAAAKDADRDQNPPSTTPPATAAAQAPPAKPEAAPPLLKKNEPVKAESEPAKTPDEQAKAESDAKETARQNRRRFEIFLKEKAAAEGGDVTEALPKDQQQPPSASDEPAATNALPPPKSQTRPESSARGAARLLAELKEPGNGAPPRAEPSAESPLPNSLASRAEGSDAFTDCPTCPVMSLTHRPEPTRRGGELAVSQSEVTVRQWSACVEDRICAPYRSVDGDPAAAVVGLSERAAREYARWLSEITGHPYSVVMPLRAQARRQDSGDCIERGQRRPDGGWDWLDDQTARDCPPSVARNGEKPQGFRVARRVSRDG